MLISVSSIVRPQFVYGVVGAPYTLVSLPIHEGKEL